MRFAQRSLRRSVVRVVAAFAPLAGCGEAHEPDGVQVNPPHFECVDASLGCAPTVISNPPAFVDAGGDPAAGDARVSDAAATRDASVASACPEREPPQGGTCTLKGAASCSYGPNCGDRPTRTATCTAGMWSLQQTSCNPPSIPCPSAAPTEDAACERGWGPPLCSYGSCDGGAGGVTFECNATRWKVVERCGSPSCPVDRPVAGAPCSYVGPACGYDDCAGVPSTRATCEKSVWSIQQVSCNPPPLDPCPALAPLAGSSCTRISGNSCTFSLSVGGQVVGACVNGKWQLRSSDAGL